MPEPGDFFLTQIEGSLGWWIRLGQMLAGGASEFSHAGLLLDDGTCVEAMPQGARVVPLETVQARRPIAWSHLPLTDDERALIVAHGRGFIGAPYGFADFLALAILHLRLPIPGVRRWVARSSRVICSQLVDEAYRRAGVKLFDDGRASMDVMPGDLATRLLSTDGRTWA